MTIQNNGRARPLAALVVLTLSIPCSAAPADARSQLDEAYALTRSAETVEDCATILRLCEQAGAAELPEDLAAYRNRLLSWTYNHRGELWVKQAATRPQPADERTRKMEAQALADFQRALHYDPQRWKALHNRAVSYASLGKYEDAVSDFKRVLQIAPNYASARFNLGEIYRELGQFPLAITHYTEALRLEPNDPAAHLGRGRSHEGLGQVSEALRDYERAIALDPRNGETRAFRGGACQALGQWEQAAVDLREACRLRPNAAGILRAAAWLMATCPEARYRQPQLAVQTAERAVELADADDYLYLDTLAAAYAGADRFADAARTAQTALDCVPTGVDRTALQRRLELYRKGEAYRQPAVTPPVSESVPR